MFGDFDKCSGVVGEGLNTHLVDLEKAIKASITKIRTVIMVIICGEKDDPLLSRDRNRWPASLTSASLPAISVVMHPELG